MHLRNFQVDCDPEGNYRPLQCRTQQGRVFCTCVYRNGTDIEGTERNVSRREEASDCGKYLNGQ